MDWQVGLPVLRGPGVTLREPRLADAPALFAHLTELPVTRFISTPPTTAAGFERFVSWVQNERQLGRHVCYAVVPEGCDEAVGLIQLRQIEAGFGTSEWGFALAERHWGTGLFMTAARLLLDFAFRTMRVHRLEARASVENGRGNGVLKKLGAIPEGILRQSFANDAIRTDQVLWAMIADDWLAANPDPLLRIDEQVIQHPERAPSEGLRVPAPWRAHLPSLRGDRVTLRELVLDDAPGLASSFANPEVARYIPPPPPNAAAFERFITWTHGQREAGTMLCFGVVPDPLAHAVGVFQLHELEPPFRTAEWGFILGRPHWGTGLFERCARPLLDFAFGTIGVRRLEARAMADNGRANAVLRRLGATEEGHLRRSFLLGDKYHDDVLWSILATDWKRSPLLV